MTNARLMDATDELSTEIVSELVLGRYRLGPRLGAGGFGTVFAATDERLRRPVAVKVIPAAGRGDPTRAQREALAAGRLDHPGIVAIFDAGQDSRARYLVSELVQGLTLDELSADGVLSDRDVLRIGLALCGALEHAHERGVVHRDV
ncbi:MAG TPA: protein kinase, partial [Solirubrobacter sp.]|nr:protein kinase [Solirubrobacter sp.]